MTVHAGMKKVLAFHQVGGLGGATQTLANVVAALADRGFATTVICPPGPAQGMLRDAGAATLDPPRDLHQFTHLQGFYKPVLHPRFLIEAWRQVRDLDFWERYIAGVAPDVVHLNAITLAPFALAAKRVGCKVSVMIQETGVHGLLGVRTRWLRWLLSNRADLVTFISDYDRKWYRCSAPKVAVVPNWVDERIFGVASDRRAARAAWGLSASDRVVVFVGGVVPIKGTLVLLQAARHLADMKGIKILIAGPNRLVVPRSLGRVQRWNRARRRCLGLDFDDLVARELADHRVRRQVRFIGEVRDVAALYSAGDVVVFPATVPHQARPAIEAGLARVPVVASDFENLREFLGQGEKAVLVPPNDAMALAVGIRRVLEDEGLAARLRIANAAHVQAAHNRSINSARIGGLFSELTAAASVEAGPASS